MERQFVTENNRERERLVKLADTITDEELSLIIYKEGWTVAVALAHLAYWDQWSLQLLRKWRTSGQVSFPLIDWETINDAMLTNDALLPLLLAIPPRVAAKLAVSSAEAIDRELEETPPEIISQIEQLQDETRLYRSQHRKLHLDEIEALLETRRGKG